MHIQSLNFPTNYPTSPNQHSHPNTIKTCSFKYPTLQSYIPSYIHKENTQFYNNQLSLSISQIHADRSPCYNTHYLNKTTDPNKKQTKTSKFFSFFKAQKLSQNNTSVCQQMLNQLQKQSQKQEKQYSGKQCDCFQQQKQINVSTNSQQMNIKRLNKTQIFMSAFKDKIFGLKQLQMDFKNNNTILLQQHNLDKEINQKDKKNKFLEDETDQKNQYNEQKIQQRQQKSQNVQKTVEDIQNYNQSCKIIQTQKRDESDNIKKQEYVDNYCSYQENPKRPVTYPEFSQQQKDVKQQSSHISDNLNSYSEMPTLQYGHDPKNIENVENVEKVEQLQQNNYIFFGEQLEIQKYGQNFIPKEEQVQEQQKQQKNQDDKSVSDQKQNQQQQKQDEGQSQEYFQKQQEEQQQQKQYNYDQKQLELQWQQQQQWKQQQQQQKFVIENRKHNQFQHQQNSYSGQQYQQQKQQHSQKQIIKQLKLVIISQQIPEIQYKNQKRQEKEQQFNNDVYIQYQRKQKFQKSEQDIDSVTDQKQVKEQQSQIQIKYKSQVSEISQIKQKSQVSEIRHINIHQADQLVNQWLSEEQSVQDMPPLVEQPVENVANKIQQQLNNIQIKKFLIIGLYLYKKITAQLISEINQIISSYYSSNYFQVIPRRRILDFMREFFVQYQSLSIWTQEQCNTKYNNYVKSLQDLLQIKHNSYFKNYYDNLKNFGKELIQIYCSNKQKIQQLKDIIGQYSGSNYFHVSKRRFIFSEVNDLIKLVEKTRKLILQDIARNKQENDQQSQHQSDQYDEQEQFDEQDQQDQQQQQNQEEQQEQQQDESLQEEQQQNQQYSQVQRNTIISNLNSTQPIRFVNDVSLLQTQVSLNASKVSLISQNIPQQQRQLHYQIPQHQYSLQKLKSYHIGKYIKQKMNNSKIASLQNTLANYNSSNYFHVGPRYQLLGFMSSFVDFVNTTNSKLNLSLPEIPAIYSEKIIKIGQQIRNYFNSPKIQQIRSTCSSYYSSNYFHVGSRYSLFGDVRKLIRFYQMME